MNKILTVGIVGAGTMGRGIAHACAASGLKVILFDSFESVLKSSIGTLRKDYAVLEAKGIITDIERKNREANVTTASTLSALRNVDLVIEAVPELLELKVKVLADIEANVAETTIIASNTSSIPITRLAAALSRPGRFLGVHFFNPAQRMPLVEIIHTLKTDQDVAVSLEEFVTDQLGKTAIVIPDRPGFVVNALLVPYLLSAIRMIDSGYADADQVDAGMRLGAGHPMGPLALSDLIGLDTLCQVADALHSETSDPSAVVPNNLRRMVEAGQLGRKSGKGFFPYPVAG